MAIARKWRPSTFDEIVGQAHVTQTLQNAIRLNRVHHAFLFAGPRGVGKTTAARTLARSLNCESGPSPTPCGACINCQEILAGNSPDVMEIDGASNNSVDDIRDLRSNVRYLPVRGKRKVYIIDEVHMLSKGAFNALLKTLEEPPDHVMFVFATTEPHKIPDTILSRVQRFEFRRIPVAIIAQRLRSICDEEEIDISEDGLAMVARAGEGSMRDAQSLLDQVVSFCDTHLGVSEVSDALGLIDRTLLYDMLQGLLLGEADRCLDAINGVYGHGYDLSEFTAEMMELLRNATLVGLSPSSKKFLNIPEDEHNQLTALVKDTPSDVFVRSFQVMLDVHDQVSRAPRPRLVLEMAVARLVSIRPAQSLDHIIDQLHALERRARQNPNRSPRQSKAMATKDGADKDGEPDPAPPPPQIATPTNPPVSIKATPNAETKSTPKDRPTQPSEPSKSGPPPLSSEASQDARFDAFRRWLKAGGVTYDVWANKSALIKVEPPYLHIAFSTPFARSQAELKQREPRVTSGVSTYFPGCTQVSIHDRAEQEGLETWEEESARQRQHRRETLMRTLGADPVIKSIQAELSATLTNVVFHDELESKP